MKTGAAPICIRPKCRGGELHRTFDDVLGSPPSVSRSRNEWRECRRHESLVARDIREIVIADDFTRETGLRARLSFFIYLFTFLCIACDIRESVEMSRDKLEGEDHNFGFEFGSSLYQTKD